MTGIQKFKHKDFYMTRLTDIGTIKDILSRHGFQFSKKLGQNFLINPSVCPRMAEACGASSQGGVLEIGPGVFCRSSGKPWRSMTTWRSSPATC